MPRYKFQAQDHNQPEIIDALRKAGWKVWVIGKPVDLLVKKGRIIGTVEVKNPDVGHKKQNSQEDHMEGGGNCGYVTTPEEALALVDGFS